MKPSNSPDGDSELLDDADDVPPPQPWEKREDESAAAFAAFCLYRDLGVARTLDAAYKARLGAANSPNPAPKGRTKKAAPAEPPRASGQWKEWYRDHQWRDRAELYDQYLEKEARKRAEAEHLEYLAAFRDRKRKLGTAASGVATALFSVLGRRVARLSKLKDEELDDAVPLGLLPALLRTATATATVGHQAEAEALAIEELLQAMDAIPETLDEEEETYEPPVAKDSESGGGETDAPLPEG